MSMPTERRPQDTLAVSSRAAVAPWRRDVPGVRLVPGVQLWWRDAVGCATWASMLVVVALWVSGGGLQALGGWASGVTALGRLAALVASDLLLVQVVLMARVPLVEKAYGQDDLARRHRLVGFWSLNLMIVHIILITAGYALTTSANPLAQLWALIVTYPGLLLATVGAGLLVLVAVTSVRKARRRLRYESWHLLHLYAYLGVGLALPHQLWTGQEFLTSTLATVYWWGVWVLVAVAVLVWRVGLPLHRTFTHRLRVVEVIRESPQVVSLVMTGRHLHRLPGAAGQFFTWRFLGAPGWTRGHPYSLSAAPNGQTLRITVKDLGDDSATLSRLRPGTRVAIEGPYGRLHEGLRTRRKVLLMASGIGVTPLRALLESLPQNPGDVTLVYRATRADHLVLRSEIESLAAARGARVLYVLGPRIPGRESWLPQSAQALTDEDALRQIVPDVHLHDVYVCGADPWMTAVRAAAQRCGVPAAAIHQERFSW